MGQNHYFNINFRADFVKPFIFTLLEIASFGSKTGKLNLKL